jgi:hypothetical protein
MGLGEKLRPIGNVHCDVLRVGAVKRSVPIRQPLAVPLPERHLIFHAEQRGKSVTCLDKRRGDIKSAYHALKPFSDIASGTAKAATNVEDVLTSLDWQTVGELYCGGKSSGMKMVYRSQVLKRHRV